MKKRMFVLGVALSFAVLSALALSSLSFAVWPFGDKKVSCCVKKLIRKNQCSEMTKEECDKAGGTVVKKCDDCK